MLTDRLKSMLRGPRDAQVSGGAPKSASLFSGRHAAGVETTTRQSRGLEEFFSYIRGQSGLTILDLGGATQQNVSFITNLGHRLYSEDFLQILNETFGADGAVDQSNPGRIEYFLRQALDYPEGHFDGVLIWDVLEYLAPALLTAVVERLHKIVRPKSSVAVAIAMADSRRRTAPASPVRRHVTAGHGEGTPHDQITVGQRR